MAMAAMERTACALVTAGVAAGASKAQMFAITAAAMNSISMEARAASSIDASVVARGAAVMEQLSLQAALSRSLGKDFCSAAAAVAEARSSGLLSGHAANAAQGVIELGNTAKHVGLGAGMQLLEAVASKRAERRARRSRQRAAEPVASRGAALGSDEAASTDDYGASTCRAPEASVPCPPLQHPDSGSSGTEPQHAGVLPRQHPSVATACQAKMEHDPRDEHTSVGQDRPGRHAAARRASEASLGRDLRCCTMSVTASPQNRGCQQEFHCWGDNGMQVGERPRQQPTSLPLTTDDAVADGASRPSDQELQPQLRLQQQCPDLVAAGHKPQQSNTVSTPEPRKSGRMGPRWSNHVLTAGSIGARGLQPLLLRDTSDQAVVPSRGPLAQALRDDAEDLSDEIVNPLDDDVEDLSDAFTGVTKAEEGAPNQLAAAHRPRTAVRSTGVQATVAKRASRCTQTTQALQLPAVAHGGAQSPADEGAEEEEDTTMCFSVFRQAVLQSDLTGDQLRRLAKRLGLVSNPGQSQAP